MPTTITAVDTPGCDTLSMPTSVDELGLAPAFPADERIDSLYTVQRTPSCAALDNTIQQNAIVSIFNRTTTAFSDVWSSRSPRR